MMMERSEGEVMVESRRIEHCRFYVDSYDSRKNSPGNTSINTRYGTNTLTSMSRFVWTIARYTRKNHRFCLFLP